MVSFRRAEAGADVMAGSSIKGLRKSQAAAPPRLRDTVAPAAERRGATRLPDTTRAAVPVATNYACVPVYVCERGGSPEPSSVPVAGVWAPRSARCDRAARSVAHRSTRPCRHAPRGVRGADGKGKAVEPDPKRRRSRPDPLEGSRRPRRPARGRRVPVAQSSLLRGRQTIRASAHRPPAASAAVPPTGLARSRRGSRH